MVESRTRNWKVVRSSSSLGPAGIVGEGSECTVLSPPSIPRRDALVQGIKPPTAPWMPQHKGLPTAPCVCVCVCVCESKAPNPQLLPGCRSINGCPLLCVCCVCVCVCVLGWVNVEHEFRVWVTIWVWVTYAEYITILGCMSRHSCSYIYLKPMTSIIWT